MATYPIKMLKDESNVPFVPLVSTGCVTDPQGRTLEQMLANKLEASNFTAGTNILLTISGNDITITNTAPGTSLIDNLDQATAGAGALDAHQGKVLKELIPTVVDNVTTVSTTNALSAYQGYLLAGKVVPSGGTTGQVLKKTTGTDWDLEWGDAADPNAISGDGTIKKIVYCTLAEYNALATIDPDTEYHIEDNTNDLTYIDRDEIEDMIEDNVNTSLTTSSTETYSCTYINGIVESGSNSNGNWVKYNDGTLVQYGEAAFGDSGTLSDSYKLVTFPIQFISNDYKIFAQTHYTSAISQVYTLGTVLTPTYEAQVHQNYIYRRLSYYSPTASEQTQLYAQPTEFCWYAMGKWK